MLAEGYMAGFSSILRPSSSFLVQLLFSSNPGETIAFIMMNSERVESELKEAEAELRITVARLQEALAGQKLVEGSPARQRRAPQLRVGGKQRGILGLEYRNGGSEPEQTMGGDVGLFIFGGRWVSLCLSGRTLCISVDRDKAWQCS